MQGKNIWTHIAYLISLCISTLFAFWETQGGKFPPVRTSLGYMWQQWWTDEWSLVSVSTAANQSSCPRYTANTSTSSQYVPATLGAAAHQLHCSDIIECSPSVNEHSSIILLLSNILVKVYNGQLMRNATMYHYDCYHYRCHHNWKLHFILCRFAPIVLYNSCKAGRSMIFESVPFSRHLSVAVFCSPQTYLSHPSAPRLSKLILFA